MKMSLREQAEAAIDIKLAILIRWSKERRIPVQCNDLGVALRDAAGSLRTEYFPTNISEFARWDGSENSKLLRESELIGVRRVANSTMYQPHNDGRLIAANTTMDALVKLRQSLQAELDPTNEVARLKIEISGLKALVKQQEQDIAAHRHMLRQVKVVSDKVTVTKGRNEREYQHRIAQLEAKNAELTQLLKRVTPMEHFKNELRRP